MGKEQKCYYGFTCLDDDHTVEIKISKGASWGATLTFIKFVGKGDEDNPYEDREEHIIGSFRVNAEFLVWLRDNLTEAIEVIDHNDVGVFGWDEEEEEQEEDHYTDECVD